MQITKQFVTAGNAHFQVTNPNGVCFSYLIKRSHREAHANQQGTLLVYTFHGERRLYVGRLNSHTGLVTIGRRSRFVEGSIDFQVVLWACNVLWTEREFPVGYTAESVGRCGACGRVLADRDQLFGPECQSESELCRAYRRNSFNGTLAEAYGALPVDSPMLMRRGIVV